MWYKVGEKTEIFLKGFIWKMVEPQSLIRSTQDLAFTIWNGGYLRAGRDGDCDIVK